MVFVVVVAESKKATFVRRRVDMILETTKTQRAFCVCLFFIERERRKEDRHHNSKHHLLHW